LKVDSFGIPVVDFSDLHVIDTYFPAYRDKLITDIDNDIYIRDVPRGHPTLDDVCSAVSISKITERENKLYKEVESKVLSVEFKGDFSTDVAGKKKMKLMKA